MSKVFLADKVQRWSIDRLLPYIRNARTHPPEQIQAIAASINEFGFLVPILVRSDGTIIAGHGRVEAARRLGLEEVPVIIAEHLTPEQARAYTIVDNRLAELAGWDEKLLALELSELMEDVDWTKLGYTEDDLDELLKLLDEASERILPGEEENIYAQQFEGPVYRPTEPEPPPLSALYDTTLSSRLREKIKAADIPEGVKAFLMEAAGRLTRFNFSKIAEYYAHASPEVQRLMEEAVLVIVDLDKAIEQGYVRLAKRLVELRRQEVGRADWDG